MKQRKYIAWILVVVCMVMLAASVLPHHHHQDFLCMHSKSAACECNSGYVAHQLDGHCTHHGHQACDAGCITNFQSVAPDEASGDVAPDYSFCSLVYTLADIFSIPLPFDTRVTYSIPSSVILHPTCVPHVMGLRAPPSALA